MNSAAETYASSREVMNTSSPLAEIADSKLRRRSLASVAGNAITAYPPGRPGMKVRSHAALIGKNTTARSFFARAQILGKSARSIV